MALVFWQLRCESHSIKMLQEKEILVKAVFSQLNVLAGSFQVDPMECKLGAGIGLRSL
jgi:hypothetical protein